MMACAEDRTFVLSDARESTSDEIVLELQTKPRRNPGELHAVGSEQAARFYAQCALDAGVAFINNMPVFIASDKEFAERFEARSLPIVGDDIKIPARATITHRVLTDLFRKAGVRLLRTYQLNTGGKHRLPQHEESASPHVQEGIQDRSRAIRRRQRLEDDNIHIGPSDYVPWQNDNKVCFLRMEGHLFGDVRWIWN